jgi:hypothetical protein
MAQILEEFPPRVRRGQQAKKYDWDSLFDGQIWQLARGEDFDSKPISMRQVAYREAASRDIRVRISMNTEAETVTIQAVK